MSKTRKVVVTMTRYYSKEVSVTIDVDENIKGESLVDHLTENDELDNKLLGALDKASFETSEDKFIFRDLEDMSGGHL